ncbi:MAG: hypothetical protein PHF45_01150 [Candidatus Pacebacteria bacterium]|nr:hypothetical protein [Candidatus Paceibacterota bacterium]
MEEKQIKNTNGLEEQEIQVQSVESKKGEGEEKQKTKRMDLIIFLFLLIPAIIKDVIEIILGLIPGVNLFVWVFSLPFTAFIFLITIIGGVRGTWIFAGHLLDLLPLASLLPISTFTVILCYIFDKSPAPVQKTIEKTAKISSKQQKK